MNRETIEKAANERRPYTEEECGSSYMLGKNVGFKRGFMDGAQWRINAVWHDGKEKPQRKDEYLLVEYKDWGSDESDYDVVAVKTLRTYASRPYSDLVRWVYISDLIPERKE